MKRAILLSLLAITLLQVGVVWFGPHSAAQDIEPWSKPKPTVTVTGTLVPTATSTPTNTPTPTPTPTATPVAANFAYAAGRLTVTTASAIYALQLGEIVYVKDLTSGETLLDANPTANRSAGSDNLVGFRSTMNGSDAYDRWPTAASYVTYTVISASQARLVYCPLYNGATASNSTLVLTVTGDYANGELVLQAMGIEADADKTPINIDVPLVNAATTGVLLGSGGEYTRSVAAVTEYTRYPLVQLYNPSVAVVEGVSSTVAAWAETTAYAEDWVTLYHQTAYDHVILHGDIDYQQRTLNNHVIYSPPWRVGTYATWNTAANRWRTLFEARTGASPLWNNRAAWVRNIHARYASYTPWSSSHVTELAMLDAISATIAPTKTLMDWLYRGQYVLEFGDSQMAAAGAPDVTEKATAAAYGFPYMLYHPWDMVNTNESYSTWTDRYNWLVGHSYLPGGYIFTPDYPNFSAGDDAATRLSKWDTYWLGNGDYWNTFNIYLEHPGSSLFMNYFPANAVDFAATHGAKALYLDTSGSDMATYGLISTGHKAMNSSTWEGGAAAVMTAATILSPTVAYMSEYGNDRLVPWLFIMGYEGQHYHVHSANHQYLFNHPLRTALLGSYAWSTGNNYYLAPYAAEINYWSEAELYGSIPEVSLDTDYGSGGEGAVDATRAANSRAVAGLFGQYDLFHDVPTTTWASGALAYYRSNTGNWFHSIISGSNLVWIEAPATVRLTITGTVTSNSLTVQPDSVAGADGYIDALQADVNGAPFDHGYIGRFTASEQESALFKFDLSSIPTNATVTSAVLTVYRNSSSGTITYSVGAYEVKQAWNGANVTWNSYDGAITATWGTAGCNNTTSDRSASAENAHALDLAADNSWSIPTMVQDWVTTPANNKGLLLMTADAWSAVGEWGFHTCEYATPAGRPKLVVTYTTP
jgi:hypothetical protein